MKRPTMRLRTMGLSLVLLLTGCLEPDAQDPLWSPHVIEADDPVPSVEENEALMAQIRANDGIPDDADMVELRRGYAGGQEVKFWDFGETPEYAIPVWLFRYCGADGMPLEGSAGMTGHKNLIDAVPGDRSYSPLWSMWIVCVTEKWQGEQITSADAVSDAVTLGLIEPPRATGMWANCPVVAPDMLLEVGELAPAMPHDGYYREQRAYYYHIGGMRAGMYMLDEDEKVARSNPVYVLYRENDPDRVDYVFSQVRSHGEGEAKAPNADYSPVHEEVRVLMTNDYQPGSIRTSNQIARVLGNGAFEINSHFVRSIERTGRMLNYDIQFEVGAP